MDIPAFVVVGAVVVVVIVAIILRSQRRAAAGFAADADARAAWARMRPKIAAELDEPAYRTADEGGRRLIGFGGQVGRISTLQRPGRVAAWAAVLPDADIHAVSELIDAHGSLLMRGMQLEAGLRIVVQSRVRTTEERRIMAQAFRRTVLGWDEAEISRRLVDPKVSLRRRTAAGRAVAAGISLVDERGELGGLTERYVHELERTESAYARARQALRPS